MARATKGAGWMNDAIARILKRIEAGSGGLKVGKSSRARIRNGLMSGFQTQRMTQTVWKKRERAVLDAARRHGIYAACFERLLTRGRQPTELSASALGLAGELVQRLDCVDADAISPERGPSCPKHMFLSSSARAYLDSNFPGLTDFVGFLEV